MAVARCLAGWRDEMVGLQLRDKALQYRSQIIFVEERRRELTVANELES